MKCECQSYSMGVEVPYGGDYSTSSGCPLHDPSWLAELMDDVCTTAFESGIGWIERVVPVTQWPKGAEYVSDVVSRGGALKISHSNTHDFLNRANLKRGILMAVDNSDYSDLQEWYENHDAVMASDALQYAMFGELVYS